jgi:hypothetical protein
MTPLLIDTVLGQGHWVLLGAFFDSRLLFPLTLPGYLNYLPYHFDSDHKLLISSSMRVNLSPHSLLVSLNVGNVRPNGYDS